jgi:hypothetical protein
LKGREEPGNKHRTAKGFVRWSFEKGQEIKAVCARLLRDLSEIPARAFMTGHQ